MSTKIYSGFRFASSDLLAIHQQMMAFRLVINDLARQATCGFLARYATRKIDAAAVKGLAVESPLAGAFSNFLDRQSEIKKTGQRDNEVDFDFSVMVMPFEGCVYGIVYTERSEWEGAFLAQDGIEEFAYWNNTDPLEGVSDEEWEARGDLWRRLIAQDPGERPVGCGFTVDFEAPLSWPDAEQVLRFVHDRQSRLYERAWSLVIEADVRPLYEAAEATEEKANPLSLYLEAERGLRTEAGKQRIAAEVARLEPILPEITLDVLMNGLPARKSDPSALPCDAGETDRG